MQFVEMGNENGKTLMLLPGTCCDYQTNFANVLGRLADKYHLICVNYDGFDGSDAIFPDMITVTEKIERYIKDNHNGSLDGALGSSLGSSFVGQLIQRRNVHLDHGIFGSPDLDQSGRLSAKLQAKLVVPLLTSFTGSEKKREKTRQKLKDFFLMSDEAAGRFMECFAKFDPDDEVLVLTDILQGSVNQAFAPYMGENTFLVAGANVACALELALSSEPLTAPYIENVIEMARQSMRLMNTYRVADDDDDE